MRATVTKFAIIDNQGRTLYYNLTEHAVHYLCISGVVGYLIFDNQRSMRPKQKLAVSAPLREWVDANISASAHLN